MCHLAGWRKAAGWLRSLSRLAQKAEHDLRITIGLDDGQEVAPAIEQHQARSGNRMRQRA